MQLEKCALQMDMKRTWNGESATAKFAAALFIKAASQKPCCKLVCIS